MTFVVAIDGPAGTGKSSVARFLARALDFIYVDTGAIYRALAFLADKYEINADDVSEVVSLIPRIAVIVDEKSHRTKIMVDEDFVEDELRSEQISRMSSLVSQHQKVREALLPVQRDLVDKIHGGAIFEGRDIGTVVFPYAPLKIFITANSETRAKRRFEELKKSGVSTTYEEVLDAIEKRDLRDETRKTAPMQKAKEAFVIDTSEMTLEDVIEEALSLIKSAQEQQEQGNDLW